MQNSYFNIIVKNNNKRWFILMILPLLVSCNAIFEKDISSETPEMIIPTSNDTLYSNQVHFKWEEVEGASHYRLQLVQPTFENIDAFILDSAIGNTEFYQVLEPGEYSYRLRAENGGYESFYSEPRKIYVDSVSDLSDQYIALMAPVDNIFTNATEAIVCSWQNLYAANSYSFVLKIGATFETGSVLTFNSDIATLAQVISVEDLAVEGTYFWGVSATNESSTSPYTYRQINVDLTPPNDPALVSPADLSTFGVDEDFTLKWSTGTDPGTVNADVFCGVEISTDPDFGSFDEYNNITSDSLEVSFSTADTYYWRVKADDAAGNFSEFYSPTGEFIVE
jgi:hypothetical protein